MRKHFQPKQAALPLRGGDQRTPETRAKFNATRARLVREIEEREGTEEVRYWERRAWLYNQK